MIKQIILALSFATALAIPMQAQFAITVEQNGQGTSAGNGSQIVMNAPSLSQPATATVVLTYIGNATLNLPDSGEILGSGNFTVQGATPTTLTQFQSVTFTFKYSPSSTAQATAEFLWPFTETATTNTASGPVTTTTGTGVITFNLVGTSPNIVIGQVAVGGTFQPIAGGGTFQFPNTVVNGLTSTTLAISNNGSGPGTINSISVTGAGYTLIGVPLLPVTLAAGNQLNVTMQFQPTSASSTNGTLQIVFGNGTTYSATLAGTGVTSFLSYNITQGATTSPLIPGQVVAMGSTNVGTPVSAIIQFQNTGTTPFVLGTLAVSGPGFAITSGPFLPITLQPQQSDSITVTYTPNVAGPSAGRLLIGNDSFGISGQGLGSTLTFSYQGGSGAPLPLLAGGTISFSPVVDGQTTSVVFTVTNTGNTASTIASIGVVDPTGVFALSNLPALPFQLAPGGNVSFTINYSPVSGGISSATLAINNQAFGLTGFPATPPPLPSYTFTGAAGTQQPFQQPAIGLSLASTYPYPLSGTLTISTALSSFSADPAVQFSSGGVQVAFTIPANTLKAVFPSGATQIQLQTGTVAGNIKITPAFMIGTAFGTNITPPNPTTLTLTVPPLAPTILAGAIGGETVSGLTIVLTGFSTTRSLDHLTIQLTPAPGFTLGGSGASFSVDVSAVATLWFQSGASQGAGGQFTVTLPLTFSEAGVTVGTKLTSAITAISVSITSSTGTSNVLQLPVQ